MLDEDLRIEKLRMNAENQLIEQLSFFQKYKLERNRQKRSWDSLSLRQLLVLLSEEIGELAEEIRKDEIDERSVCLEAADVANYAGMIINNIVNSRPKREVDE